ncbi:unnamed protein product, partial [Protopolystoma xenopodis]
EIANLHSRIDHLLLRLKPSSFRPPEFEHDAFSAVYTETEADPYLETDIDIVDSSEDEEADNYESNGAETSRRSLIGVPCSTLKPVTSVWDHLGMTGLAKIPPLATTVQLNDFARADADSTYQEPINYVSEGI